MDYRRFVRLREDSCREFETALERARQRRSGVSFDDLERMSFLYRQLLHDHSLAAARFPGTAMARRLKRLVLAGTHVLQTDTGEHLPSLRRFVTRTFPVTLRKLAPEVAIVASLFVVTAVLGFVLTTFEPMVATGFLPVEVLENLARGEIWIDSVFRAAPGSVLGSFIATNNLSVALTAWAGGALAGIGSLWIALYNGLMLGSVLAATAQYGMEHRLLEFIAAHGPLELSLIMVSAAAGLHMGRSMVTAGDLPRGVRLRRAALDALIVLLGCLPWILLLGFVEGYVSPSRELGVATKVLVGILLEGTFVAWALLPGRRETGRGQTGRGQAAEATA